MLLVFIIMNIAKSTDLTELPKYFNCSHDRPQVDDRL